MRAASLESYSALLCTIFIRARERGNLYPSQLRRWLAVLAVQLEPRNRPRVHLVRTVREAQRPNLRPHVRQRPGKKWSNTYIC